MFRSLDISALTRCQPRRICIVKPSALGDVVQSLPVLGPLRARWPDVPICWVIREDLSDLVDGHPLIDDWLPYQRHDGARAFLRLLKQLRAGCFDLTIDLQGLARSALMTAATGAPFRIGLESSREAAFLSHNLVLPGTGSGVPASARYWSLAEVLGHGEIRRQARIPISALDRERVMQWLAHARGLTIAVHPGAVWQSKRWPVGRFAALMVRAVRELECSLVVVGREDERSLTDRFIADVGAAAPGVRICDQTGRTSVGQLAALLQHVDLLLSNDSGPMHLAAALGTPVVGVFTATDPSRSGPVLTNSEEGPRHELVTTESPCRACYRRRCPLTGQRQYACQRDLSVDHVWQALVRCIKRNGLRPERATTPIPAAAEPAVRRAG